MDISASSSYEFYLTPEKALEDIYDKYARRTSEEANYDYLIETKIEERIQAFRMAGNSEKDQLKFTVEAMDDEA